MARKQTRGSYYGIDASALARDAVAKLNRLRIKVAKLQEPWAESDPMVEAATEVALQGIDDLIKQYQESAAYMRETMDD